ncbi:MAG: ATP phosphoribosyltransferase regulatory subunit [Pseudomonadota bacterium]
MSDALLPEGFRDRLPPFADAAARFEDAVLGVARGYGYERVDPPLVEFEASLAGRLGGAGTRAAVRFVDPHSQRTLAIRPDITAQIGRIAATRLAANPRPVRLSYAGAVLRLRAAPLDPARERRQVGCELIGRDSVAAASEIVAVAVAALNAAGVSGLSLDFTFPDLVDALAAGPLPLAPERIEPVRAALDAKDAGKVADLAPAYLPLIAAAGPFDQALARLRAFDGTGVLASRLDGLAAIAAGLASVRLTLDPTERHGFEYQSWFGFSLFADGVAGEIGRGGSYRIHRDGGAEPATGFSLFPDMLAAAAVDDRRRLWLPLGTDPALADRLRGEGWVAVAALDDTDSAAAQLCTHVLGDGMCRPL